MVCIAGGSGMSAVNAIVEEAVALGVERDCYFFYGARTKDDLYLIDEMNEIKSSWNKKYKFEFIPVLSEEPDDSGWDGGRVLLLIILEIIILITVLLIKTLQGFLLWSTTND